jgi:hypothetical protein
VKDGPRTAAEEFFTRASLWQRLPFTVLFVFGGCTNVNKCHHQKETDAKEQFIADAIDLKDIEDQTISPSNSWEDVRVCIELLHGDA